MRKNYPRNYNIIQVVKSQDGGEAFNDVIVHGPYAYANAVKRKRFLEHGELTEPSNSVYELDRIPH